MSFRGECFAALQRLVPQHGLSRLTARLAESETPWLKNMLIKGFIKKFDIDLSEARYQSLESYDCFNEFFTRQLKPDLRPVDSNPDSIASPADGTVSQIGAIDDGRVIQAKGKHFSTTELLGSTDDADFFNDGRFTTIYLSPKDYHRVHMPVNGTLLHTRYIPGDLFSVNNDTAEHIPNLFARNERLVCLFETDFGKVAVVMVGAMLVAGIGTVWQKSYPPNPGVIEETLFNEDDAPTLAKGEEMGHFNFGSTVILLFEAESMDWLDSINSGEGTQMGQQIGLKNL
ncbi:archaetidylserine decarboxylase [Porticoccaceae bacterium LTM1]|nr:archaetidylserine decarboxylase [Porticoccaceae bacterium LTM1]